MAINSLPTGSVIISGTPTEGEILTASSTLADADGLGTLEYHWMADGIDVAGDGGPTLLLTQETVGRAVTTVVFYTDQQGTLERVESAPTTEIANVNNLPTGSVIVSGTPIEGEILTASSTLADEDGLGTLEYHWMADGIDVAGDGGPTLLLTQETVGRAVTAVVFYTDQQGTLERVESAPTLEIANVNDLPMGSVIISGTPAEDQVLIASNTLVDADGIGAVSYQWQANGTDIAGATSASLTLTQAQVGSTITVLASYIDQQGTPESVGSAATTPVANVNDPPTGSVIISGTPTEGDILTASQTLADEDGLGTISYQWRADGTDIAGAINASFVLTQAQVGSTITVLASYTDQQGTPESVSSAATSIVAPPTPPFYHYTLTASGIAGQTAAVPYNGPVDYLSYEYAGSFVGEAVVGTTYNDFIHVGAADDAVDGGRGDDVIDGGTGSNFLSGGAGRDVFVLDGRNGETTWSTITDWHAGEELTLWGWIKGISQATWVVGAGAEGYRGATLHADLDGNGVIDASVTWAGLVLDQLPAPTEHDNLLWFA